MNLSELSNEQRRQLIDVRQIFNSWRAARKGAKGSMRWVSRAGNEYLHHKQGKSERSLGRRSPETEKIMAEHTRHRNRFRQAGERLKKMAPVNKALRLNRLPRDATLVLSALDAAGVLGKHLFVIGTNALYAYEMQAGVLFESAIVATGDFDLLWDARNTLRLAAPGLPAGGILGILRQADPSFSGADDYGTRAQNARGYFVDLFCPDRGLPPRRMVPGDIDPIPAEGAEWLINARKIEETVIGSDGMPLYMPCADPRIFALHKWWLSRQPSRQPTSRPRDAAQARAVAAVAMRYLGQNFRDSSLSPMPAALKPGMKELERAGDDLEVEEIS